MRNLIIYRYIDTTARVGSIRKAAEILAITPSSLNRRILALEEEIGAPLFERLSRGVRLTTAGEQAVHVFRRHLAEAEGMKTFIADLKGMRRGEVSVVCSQALLPIFLPNQIRTYQKSHPGVRFLVRMADAEAAERALLTYAADLALVFTPLPLSDFETICAVRQPIHALMATGHPLAGHRNLRLSDCLDYPLVLPARPYALRNLLERAASRLGVKLQPVVETESFIFQRNFAALGDALAFEIEIGLPARPTEDLLSKRVELGKGGGGLLHLGQLRGRTLPVSAARFADQLMRRLID